jgi:DNA-binding FrmR family transcriptional regulator
MLASSKQKTLAAIKRLEGLTKKLRVSVEDDSYCTDVLALVLSMQGHLRHIQGTVLESHLSTCGQKKLSSPSQRESFIKELLSVIGLSQR